MGCSGPVPGIHQHELFAFGTLIELTFYGVSAHEAREATQLVDAMYQRQHRDWHAWQRGQLLELNEAIAQGRPARVDTTLAELIRRGQEVERLSQGLFNPAIGNLLNLWGFQSDEPSQGPPPSGGAIGALVAAGPSSLALQLNGLQVQSANTAVRLDLGGFAKGYSVGKATQLIEEKGILNFIINAGGDLCIRGQRGPRPWRIGIRDPRRTDVLASIELQGAACVFTSGDYQRFFEFEGKRYHHILDPRTGYPAARVRSVTVVAEDPTLADAAATALFVAGPERWPEIAVALGVDDVLLLDGSDTAQATPGLAASLTFVRTPSAVRVVHLGSAAH